MTFSPDYVRIVLSENFEDAKAQFLTPLLAIEYAHLVMLAEQQIVAKAEAGAIRRALDAISEEEIRAVKYDGTYEDLFFYLERLVVAGCGEDTAGRLHNKANLMAELEKMKRISSREVEGAPHETLLVIDAVTGQNGLEQARQFMKTADVTGIVLTKLDGTAKGGIVVAIAKELNLPIRYVGIGEQVNDLMVFDPESYVNGLFN